MAAPRQAATAQTREASLAAPIRGWWTNQNRANSDPLTARVLDNWICTETGVKVRGGASKYATLAGGVRVDGFLEYIGTTGTQALFACDATSIYDVSSIADPDASTTAVSGLSSFNAGDWQGMQFGTSGGDYLICCNTHTSDAAYTYDGTTWTDVDSIGAGASGDGGDTTEWTYVWSYANRIFAVKEDSQTAYYGPVDSIAGSYSSINLESVFIKGGYLLFGASWSVDAGDGADDRCVFVSSEGEVAIYTGDFDSTINLIGRYDIGKPVGRKAHMRAGGDLIIATEDGMVPLSAAVTKDAASLQLSAVSRPIEPEWKTQYRNRIAAKPFEVLKWAVEAIAIIALPHSGIMEQYVVNLETGAWSRFTGWDAQTMGALGDRAFYGDGSGVIYEMLKTGYDGTAIYNARLQYADNLLGAGGRYKQVSAMRGLFVSNVGFAPKISAQDNFGDAFPAAPSAAANTRTAAIWDSGIWDDSAWDDAEGPTGGVAGFKNTRWVSVSATGFSIAPQVQINTGASRKPDAELVQVDMVYVIGGMVV